MKATVDNNFKPFDMTITFESEEEASKLYALLDNPAISKVLGHMYCLELRRHIVQYYKWDVATDTHKVMLDYLVLHHREDLQELLNPSVYEFTDSLGNELKIGDMMKRDDIEIPIHDKSTVGFAGMDGDKYLSVCGASWWYAVKS